MFEPKTLEPKSDRQILTSPPSRKPAENSQQRLMVGALVLLLAALGLLLYHDRDFWFPDTQEAEDQPEQSVPTITTPVRQPAIPAAAAAVAKKPQSPKTQAKVTAPVTPSSPPVSATTQRTVLPPLEVEVVAGDSHSKVHPGTNSVRVDLQPGSPPQAVADGAAAGSADTAAGVTSNAAERVQMSADTVGVVSHSVRPGYPLLARQMKVQGSVILQALISRDGAIQDLHVVSGPPILASAAQEAVKQWRFKPHYLGSEAVETQARITVNFTISTN
jgi:protein TonB